MDVTLIAPIKDFYGNLKKIKKIFNFFIKIFGF